MTRPADWSIWIPHRFNLPLLVGQGRRSFDGARHTPSTVRAHNPTENRNFNDIWRIVTLKLHLRLEK